MNDTLTLEAAVETMARALEPHAWKVKPSHALWVDDRRALACRQARAALAALAKVAGMDAPTLARLIGHQDAVAVTMASEWDRHGYDADVPHRRAAALLRILAEASDD
jgi:hypothetical protein